MAKGNIKTIRASIKNGDDTKVRVSFYGDAYTPEEFTSLFMAILETYTEALLKTNTKEAVYTHFNNVFGIYLNKLLPEEKIYKKSKSHKEFKKMVDATLGKENTEDVKSATEDNRFAAYLLARDILTTEIGLTEDAADIILNKRLGLSQPETSKVC